MNGYRHLPDDEREHMERELAKHYGERVAPVSAYCDAFRAWHKALGERVKREDTPRDEGLVIAYEALSNFALQLAISKSSMLGRLIYGGEKLRTEKCPEHDGRWVGLEWADNRCPHGCHLTGWLPAQATASKTLNHDRRATMPADGFKLFVPHAEDCWLRNEDQRRVFVVHDRLQSSGRDRTGRRNPRSSTGWHVFRCNDPDCPAEAGVRWDVLAELVTAGLERTQR